MSVVLLGSTSGSITLQEPAVAGTTVLTLPAVTGTVLTTTSPKAGNVIQVVNATYSTITSNSTSTYADTGLTASITPSSSSSKILVLVSQNGCRKQSNDTYLQLRLNRGATAIVTFSGAAGYTGTVTTNDVGSVSTVYLDSPATTSSVTYKTQLASGTNSVQVNVQTASDTSTITLMEIAA